MDPVLTDRPRELFRRTDLLGTVVDVTVVSADPVAAAGTATSCFAEIGRLQSIFNSFDPESELSRWRRGEAIAGPELSAVSDLAVQWRSRTHGAIEPAIGTLMHMWDEARLCDRPPGRADVSRALEAMRSDPIAGWNLNAIAKGWIVDGAARVAREAHGVDGVIVNAGGDLLALGDTPTIVGIENPHRPYDNVPPLTTVALDNAALATSGNSRRGWRIGDAWYGHVIDPRTGWPVDHVASASVIAPDAATADVVATALTVLPVVEGLALATRTGAGCLVMDRDGRLHRNASWHAAETSSVGTPRRGSVDPQDRPIR